MSLPTHSQGGRRYFPAQGRDTIAFPEAAVTKRRPDHVERSRLWALVHAQADRMKTNGSVGTLSRRLEGQGSSRARGEATSEAATQGCAASGEGRRGPGGSRASSAARRLWPASGAHLASEPLTSWAPSPSNPQKGAWGSWGGVTLGSAVWAQGTATGWDTAPEEQAQVQNSGTVTSPGKSKGSQSTCNPKALLCLITPNPLLLSIL